MPNSNRVVALGLLGAFGAVAAGALFWSPRQAEPLPPPTLLPAAHANPAAVVVRDTLQAGETLTDLLRRARLAEADAHTLLVELQQHQDPRRLRPGSILAFERSVRSGDVRKMEFRLDADHTLNMRRAGETWAGSVEAVQVQPDTAVLAGTVRSSLYAALLDGDGAGVPAREREWIADILADRIFAWQIDFARDLRAGDAFQIVYERLVRPDGTARSGRVLGVRFNIDGQSRDAYWFTAPDGAEDYYDSEGESLRRAFLRAPLEFRRISSAYSTGRFHPILKKTRPHHGIDYAARAGTPIRAVGDGVVTRAGRDGGYGNVVEIRHKRGYASRYAHMQGFADGVRAGARIKQGQLIGYVGSTGLSTGPHLHYEFHENGRPVNPNTVKFITGDPVPRRAQSRFEQLVRRQWALMDRDSAALAAVDASVGRQVGGE